MFKPIPQKITSLQNEIVKHLVHLRQNSSYRKECNSILVTGTKIIQELSAYSLAKKILFLPSLEKTLPAGKDRYEVTEAILKKVTGQASPEPIVAEFSRPSPSSLEGLKWVVGLDRLADPGNVGTLLRTLVAFGWEGVFLVQGGVDLFHEKVISASRGALFSLKWREGSVEELLAFSHHNSLPLWVADREGEDFLASVPSLKEKGLLILGNEAHGADPCFKEQGKKIKIPMKAAMESLNVAVAGGILLYYLKDPHG